MAISSFLDTAEPFIATITIFPSLVIIIINIRHIHTSKKVKSRVGITFFFLLGVIIMGSWFNWNNFENIYTNATNANATFSDSLRDSTDAQWDNSQWSDGSIACQITNGDYHVRILQDTYFTSCLNNTDNFSNFAYQIQMSIIKGDQGCIVFRYDEVNAQTFYMFCLDTEGNYTFIAQTPDGYLNTLEQGTSSAMVTGLNHINTVAVVAQNDVFDFYVNKLFVLNATDDTAKNGEVGVGISNNGDFAEVVFNNAQVWRL